MHLGADDLSVAAARRVGRRPARSSAPRPRALRRLATPSTQGADYLGCGPAFATPIKSAKAVIGPKGVAAVAAAAGPEVPVFAIGGIDESNVAQLTALGVRRACVIRAVVRGRRPRAGGAPPPCDAGLVTKVGGLGEFGLLERIRPYLSAG